MAKKNLSLKDQLHELEGKEQTPEVLAEIEKIEALMDEMKNIKEVKKSPFTEFEVWKLERDQADKTKLVRSKMLKKVMILQEHADTLNEQKENTMLEYVR